MMNVIACLADDHDIRLVALSAAICALGCFTFVTLLSRAETLAGARLQRLLGFAAVVFGCSVWALHFVAMLAFLPGQEMAYDVDLTGLSVVVASVGAAAGLRTWHSRLPWRLRAVLAGLLLGLAVSGMHYLGVAAMTFSGLLMFDPAYVAASVAVSVGFSILAVARSYTLRDGGRVTEVSGWLALAIFGLHYTGMAAITLVPGTPELGNGTVLGTATLALVVGAASVVILVAGLACAMIKQHLNQRTIRDLNRLRLMSNLAQEILFIHRDGVVLEVNSAGERLFKAHTNAIVGQQVTSLFTQDSAPILARRQMCAPADRQPEEVRAQPRQGGPVTVELSCQPIDYLGKPATAVALRDLTARKRDEERIRYLARHDALTGLPNRYSLMERLDLALSIAAQRRDTMALAFIDLDRFKPVNDLYGHAAGDKLLVQVTRRILAEIGPGDTLARIGGDEFIMILGNDSQPAKISQLATHVIEALGKPFTIEGHRVEIGASIGIAVYPADGWEVDTLMRAADAAMYRAKEEGRGALRFYEKSMNANLQARLQLEQELGGAMERGELVLHYQPMVNGSTGVVETFEALLRWEHPLRGTVPPVEFIGLAEETGLITSIGRWVIETACREAAGWAQPWRVSVNVSPMQFHQSDLCEVIGMALRLNRLEPGRLVVEVTESIWMDQAERTVATLNQLRDMGVRVALDDFGTGYSSLSYLQLFRFDKFKIDKSFVRKLGQNEDALTLTRSIINLGHNLGLDVTAEGVETPAQLAILQSLGCDQIQGYVVARPAPVDAFTEIDRRRTMALFDSTGAPPSPDRKAAAVRGFPGGEVLVPSG